MLRGLIVLVAGVLALATPASAQSRFDGWTAAIIQADWRDGYGRPIEAFDNARRDLAQGFRRAGFNPADTVDFSLEKTAPDVVVNSLRETAARATRGCLIYFTSHGAPDGMVFGDAPRMAPDAMANLVRAVCGERPTVVVVSACYSGIFVSALQGPNRMVLTAARRDRSSFGCGADERYPWFDGCILEALPEASDFLALAAGARACVNRKETEYAVDHPSEPQLFVGANMQLRLPTLRFSNRTP
ncbi:C13 family peptidase [Brevundimonas sp. FT23028]|uniref:C13 family peptidase n=1 Tax=Brevundimonas sp. FT23028 TaxID=3393748 RepID=UPI003B5884BD